MVQSLQATKGGGGSIRVGTTGTISSLMTREMDSMKVSSHHHHQQHHHKSLPSSSTSTSTTNKPQVVSLPNSRRPTPRTSLEIEPSSSTCSNISSINGKANFTGQQDLSARKPKGSQAKGKNTHRIPMLGSDNISLDTTPSRDRVEKKGPTIINIVEVVDIKCGTSDSSSNRAWTVPITSRLRKLGFSKLSDSIV